MSESKTAPNSPIEIEPELEVALLEKVRDWEPELRELLTELPDDITVELDNRHLIKSTGTGGFAAEPSKIYLSFDPSFEGDKESQMIDFRASFYHEAYHLVQGFVGSDETSWGETRLENAILEGAATKFEMIRAGSNPGWGQYDETEIKDWVKEVAALTKEDDIIKWKFYDPDTGRRWIMYRSGSYIVDQALQKSGLQIEGLVRLKPMEIYKLSGLSEQ